MPDIRHRIGVLTPTPQKVYQALTTVDDLAGWWTQDTTGRGDQGGVLKFRFPPVGGFDMHVLETRPGERVVWQVTGGPDEWIGTTVRWELQQAGDYTIILFSHEGWAEPVEFMYHCSTKWATFLLSLKSLIETGKGEPAPNDLQISDWH
jgi:uncharacterized protein YndB with AHSA1/START domain